DLMARVDERIHAPAVEAPPRQSWSNISADSDEYRRIRLTGTYLHENPAFVQATTALGAGFWVLTPFQLADGSIVLVNRGFVPQDRKDGAWRHSGRPGGTVTITGLLRLSEPDGAFLRANDPAADRWHSRDVAQIAASR